jgi:hypothetical protein
MGSCQKSSMEVGPDASPPLLGCEPLQALSGQVFEEGAMPEADFCRRSPNEQTGLSEERFEHLGGLLVASADEATSNLIGGGDSSVFFQNPEGQVPQDGSGLVTVDRDPSGSTLEPLVESVLQVLLVQIPPAPRESALLASQLDEHGQHERVFHEPLDAWNPAHGGQESVRFHLRVADMPMGLEPSSSQVVNVVRPQRRDVEDGRQSGQVLGGTMNPAGQHDAVAPVGLLAEEGREATQGVLPDGWIHLVEAVQ